MIRVLLIPIMAVLLEYDSDQPPFHMDWTLRLSPGRFASLLVAVAGLTDYLDGYFARKWKLESLLGKFLDPVADKLFLLVGLIMLMKLGRVDAWLVILLLSREFLITGLRGVAAAEGMVIAAGSGGKFKLTLQMIGLGFVMWYGNILGFKAYPIGMVVLYIALLISLLSGFQYLSDFFTGQIQRGKRV